MEKLPSAHQAHHCSFHPDRQIPYLRLNTVTVYVRNQERSLRFYQDLLGFDLAYDFHLPTGERWLAVTPPDGTGMISLVAPGNSADERSLIGRATHVTFLTEDISATYQEWCDRGVRFLNPPQSQSGVVASAIFEDPDGNAFVLLASEEMMREVKAQRHAHVEKRESDRRASLELDLARNTQARLLPQAPLVLKTLHCHAACFPARAVGGDYYDFLDVGRERVGVVIGDVSGKGTAAALLMANLQAHMRDLCLSYWSRPFVPFALEQPGRLLQAINRLLYENTRGNAYSTLFFAEFDAGTRRLRFANCGHPGALLQRADGPLEQLDSTCTVLGLFNAWDCGIGERQLSPGDTLVLYTDGVTESFNAAGEEFGQQRLADAVRRNRDLPPPALLAALADDVRKFSPHEQADDLTLIVAKCK